MKKKRTTKKPAATDANCSGFLGQKQCHGLKTWTVFWGPVRDGDKNFEVRKDDRGYMTGDFLCLREWDGVDYTGRWIVKRVTYVLTSEMFEGVRDGFVVMGLEDVPAYIAGMVRNIVGG